VDKLTIFHNPGCSKCREALALLEGGGHQPEIVEYLTTPPTAAELEEIVRKLGIRPEQLVRKGEALYKAKYAQQKMSDAEWIQAMVENPILIERPIVVRGKQAVIGRPPTAVLALLGD
jgi:arsenate reductase (glutaredoxin)